MALNGIPPQGTNIPRTNNAGGINGVIVRMGTKYLNRAMDMRSTIKRSNEKLAKRDLKGAAEEIKNLKRKLNSAIDDFHKEVRPLLKVLKRENVKGVMNRGFLGFKTPKVMKMDKVLYDLRVKVRGVLNTKGKPMPKNLVGNNNKPGFFRRLRNRLFTKKAVNNNKKKAVNNNTKKVLNNKVGPSFLNKVKGGYQKFKNSRAKARNNALTKKMLKNIRNVTGKIYNANNNSSKPLLAARLKRTVNKLNFENNAKRLNKRVGKMAIPPTNQQLLNRMGAGGVPSQRAAIRLAPKPNTILAPRPSGVLGTKLRNKPTANLSPNNTFYNAANNTNMTNRERIIANAARNAALR
jgi:hypothetical protein